MIQSAIQLVIGLVIFGLLYWLVGYLPLPAIIHQVATVLLVVLAVLWLIDWLLGIAGQARPWRGPEP